MKLLKRKMEDKKDEAVILQYTEWTKQFADIQDYILGQGISLSQSVMW